MAIDSLPQKKSCGLDHSAWHKPAGYQSRTRCYAGNGGIDPPVCPVGGIYMEWIGAGGRMIRLTPIFSRAVYGTSPKLA